MKKRLFCLAFVAAFGATSAYAATVASTSKKGSLLIFPLISVDPASRADTFVEISNDFPEAVHIECTYVNETKGRVDFDFDLGSKATVSWDVARPTANDGVKPPPFPGPGKYPRFGSQYRGELICFAVKGDLTTQISFNHLHGNATVLQNGTSLKYNPWSFQALKNGAPNPNNGESAGIEPGVLPLIGVDSGYDACPKYNVTTFMPNGATLGNISTIGNAFSFASCNQDLRSNFRLHLTTLQFEKVWNSGGGGLSHAYQCVDSVGTTLLGGGNRALYNGSNFDFSSLQTPNARYQVEGVSSKNCSWTQGAGLLGLGWATVRTAGSATVQLIGTTTHGAGYTPGFVKWSTRERPPLLPPAR